jgi:hypothetical protein
LIEQISITAFYGVASMIGLFTCVYYMFLRDPVI